MNNQSSDLVNEVRKGVGANLLLFQQIETGLKILLPFVYHPNSYSKEKILSFGEKQKRLESQTLGMLMREFSKSYTLKGQIIGFYRPPNYGGNSKLLNAISPTSINSVKNSHILSHNSLLQIVEERNKLVHHFPFSEVFSSEKSCKACLAALEKQHKKAYFLHEILATLIRFLFWELQDYHGQSQPEFKLTYEAIRENNTPFINNIEYVNLSDPSDTIWESTKIVGLLRLAELQTEQIDGMTLLSRAGKFIKVNDPQCIPKEYGIKSLKGALKASGSFKVVESQFGTLYKSKSSS